MQARHIVYQSLETLGVYFTFLYHKSYQIDIPQLQQDDLE